jgi:hypothetical protein
MQALTSLPPLAGWGSWTFSARPTVSGDNLTLHFTAGGNQEARGDKEGGPSYIDNALCELDAPGEWFWDANTQTLFMAQNGSVPLPTKLVAPQLETLIHGEIYMYAFTSVSSQTEVSEISQDHALVKGVTVTGVTLAHSRATYLSTYEMPTGGERAFPATPCKIHLRAVYIR